MMSFQPSGSVRCNDTHIFIKQMPHQQQPAVCIESPPPGRTLPSPSSRQEHIASAHCTGFKR